MMSKVFTPEAAIENGVIVGVNIQTLYRLMRTGGLPCIKVGRRYLISETELARWAEKETRVSK